MRNIRVVIEFRDSDTGSRLMRWERAGPSESSAFELLGRAFEVMQREEKGVFKEAIGAFLKGALLEKQDVVEALGEPS